MYYYRGPHLVDKDLAKSIFLSTLRTIMSLRLAILASLTALASSAVGPYSTTSQTYTNDKMDSTDKRLQSITPLTTLPLLLTSSASSRTLTATRVGEWSPSPVTTK